MSKVPMVSTGKHVYEGKQLFTGDKFEVNSQEDADDLKILGFAERDRSASPQAYEARVVEAAPTATDSVAAAAQSRRQYARRDLQTK